MTVVVNQIIIEAEMMLSIKIRYIIENLPLN